MGEQKPEKTKKHICAGLLAHVKSCYILEYRFCADDPVWHAVQKPHHFLPY